MIGLRPAEGRCGRVQQSSQPGIQVFQGRASEVAKIYPTAVGFLLESARLCSVLNENDGLRAGNLEPAPATRVSTGKHVVNPDHIITRLLKSRAILFVRATRRLRLLRSLQPSDIVFAPFATMRTTVGRFLDLFLFVKEISFVHYESFSTNFRSGCSHSSLKYRKL